jgi:hypothetical protein
MVQTNAQELARTLTLLVNPHQIVHSMSGLAKIMLAVLVKVA